MYHANQGCSQLIAEEGADLPFLAARSDRVPNLADVLALLAELPEGRAGAFPLLSKLPDLVGGPPIRGRHSSTSIRLREPHLTSLVIASYHRFRRPHGISDPRPLDIGARAPVGLRGRVGPRSPGRPEN